MMYYLAGPYTGNEEKNLNLINHVTIKLMQNGYKIFSPISHGAMILRDGDSKFLKEQGGTYHNWEALNFTILDKACDAMIVIQTDDQRTANSQGTTREILFAKSINKVIYWVNENGEFLSQEKSQELTGSYEPEEVEFPRL